MGTQEESPKPGSVPASPLGSVERGEGPGPGQQHLSTTVPLLQGPSRTRRPRASSPQGCPHPPPPLPAGSRAGARSAPRNARPRLLLRPRQGCWSAGAVAVVNPSLGAKTQTPDGVGVCRTLALAPVWVAWACFGRSRFRIPGQTGAANGWRQQRLRKAQLPAEPASASGQNPSLQRFRNVPALAKLPLPTDPQPPPEGGSLCRVWPRAALRAPEERTEGSRRDAVPSFQLSSRRTSGAARLPAVGDGRPRACAQTSSLRGCSPPFPATFSLCCFL